MIRTTRLSILLLFLPLAALAQSGVWGARGISRRFLPDGNYVIAIDGHGLSVYDVSDPASIRRLSSIETEAESVDGSIAGHDLYVSTRSAVERYTVRSDGGIVQTMHVPIVGVTNIATNGRFVAGAMPGGVSIWQANGAGLFSLIGQYPTTNAVTALAWNGDVLFIGIAAIGIRVVDGNSAADLAYIPEGARGLAIAGDILYSASGESGVGIYSVGDPAAPHFLGRTSAGVVDFESIAVSGSRVIAGESSGKVHLIDASSTSLPQDVITINEAVTTLAAIGNRFFVSGATFDIFGNETDTGIPIRAYDMTTLAAPRVAAEVRDYAGPVGGVATDGTLAYVSDPPYFRILDVSTTNAPREIASLQINGVQPLVKVRGAQAVVYGRGDVQLIDISDPYHPKLVNTFHSLGRNPSTAAFAATGILEGNPWSGFHVLDFYNYSPPGIIAGIRCHPYDVVANGGDYAYVNREAHSLIIANLPSRNMAAIVNEKLMNMLGMDFAPATANRSNALIIRGFDGMHVLTLDDPANPTEIGFAPLDAPGPFAASGDAVWIASPGGMARMDISNPTTPLIAPAGMRVVAPQQVAAAKGKVVVADRYTVRVFGPNTAAPPPPVPARTHAARH